MASYWLGVPRAGFETRCSLMFSSCSKSGCSVRCRSLFLAVNRWFRCQFCCHTRFTLIFADLDTFWLCDVQFHHEPTHQAFQLSDPFLFGTALLVLLKDEGRAFENLVFQRASTCGVSWCCRQSSAALCAPLTRSCTTCVLNSAVKARHCEPLSWF